MDNNYYLLDSRAGILALSNSGVLETEDNGKYVLLVGTLKECCTAANKKEYGEHCIISDANYNIPWELYTQSGHWSYKQFKNK
jgi:hypothetical protein